METRPFTKLDGKVSVAQWNFCARTSLIIIYEIVGAFRPYIFAAKMDTTNPVGSYSGQAVNRTSKTM